MSMVTLALVCFVSGLLSGVMGFGALIIMVPALVFLVGPGTAIPLGVLCGIASQSMNAFFHRRHIQTDALVPLLLGSLPGIWLGSAFLFHLPETWLRAALGAFIVCYVLWSLFGRLPPPTRPPAAFWAYTAGFFSGAFGGAFGVNGPPAVVYATRTGWSPDVIRAFLGVFCALLFVVTAVVQSVSGVMGADVWRLSLLAVPTCLAGNSCGRFITTRLQAEQYMRLIFLLLFTMGVSLCWPAFRVLVSGLLG